MHCALSYQSHIKAFHQNENKKTRTSEYKNSYTNNEKTSTGSNYDKIFFTPSTVE